MANASSQPPSTLPPELTALFAARDPAEQARAWSAFLKTHSRVMMHAARVLGSDYDAMMDRYTFALEQLRQDDFRRLRAYVADGRGKFTTWLTVVVRRLALDLGNWCHGAHVLAVAMDDVAASRFDLVENRGKGPASTRG